MLKFGVRQMINKMRPFKLGPASPIVLSLRYVSNDMQIGIMRPFTRTEVHPLFVCLQYGPQPDEESRSLHIADLLQILNDLPAEKEIGIRIAEGVPETPYNAHGGTLIFGLGVTLLSSNLGRAPVRALHLFAEHRQVEVEFAGAGDGT